MLSNTKELRARTVVKALTWRAIATSTTVALAYAATGDLRLAGAIGVADVIIKLTFYYIHERAWGHIAWGKAVPRA
jgi:Predicted membrane protein